jgi:hypothetical protein
MVPFKDILRMTEHQLKQLSNTIIIDGELLDISHKQFSGPFKMSPTVDEPGGI